MLKLRCNILIIFAVAVLATALFMPITPVYASGLSLTIVAKNRIYTFSNLEISCYNNKYYLNDCNDIVDGIYLDTVSRPKDAEVVFLNDNSGNFYITKSAMGSEFDKQALIRDIDYALNNNLSKVVVKFHTTYPKTNEEDLKKQTCLRSAFTTYFFNSTQGRKDNIKLSAEKINGTKILKGEEFSFNKKVGKRTEENGFKNAKIILNGDFIDGIGGGVCQVSTTLYNCALLSGLKITEQHSHSLSVSYIEPSFDAMVNSITSDLKFLNDTNGDIYISAVATDNKITFKIYGKEKLEEYERVSVVTNTTSPEPFLELEDETIPFGERLITQYPKDGIESEGYLIKYINGVRVNNYKIRSDKYSPVRGKILVGKQQA